MAFDYEKRLRERYPNEDLSLVSKYINMRSEVTIRCNKCGTEYHFSKGESPLAHAKKCLCSKCINNGSGGRLDLVSAQEKLNSLYPKESLELLNYTYMKEPCDVRCKICGNTYHYTRGENLLNPRKFSVCKNCRPNKDDIIEAKRQIIYDKIKNGMFKFELLDDLKKYQGADLVPAKCKLCGKINYKTCDDYAKDRMCSCECKNELKTLQQYQSEIDDDYEVLEYKGMDHQAKFRHKICGFIYDKSAKNYRCPRCKKLDSRGERFIEKFLSYNNIAFETQKNVKIAGHNLRFDFFLPDTNTFIEFQGEQHYYPVKFFGGEERFKKQVEYDSLKRNWTKENGYTLIEINDENKNQIQELLNL